MFVFIAHAEADQAAADDLKAFLKTRGLVVETETGARGFRHLQQSDVVIALWSQKSVFGTHKLQMEKRMLDAWADEQLVLVKLDHGFLPIGMRDLSAIDASFEQSRKLSVWPQVERAAREAMNKALAQRAAPAPPTPSPADGFSGSGGSGPVFVSHTAQDQAAADAAKLAINASGREATQHSSDFVPNEWAQEAADAAIQPAEVVVGLWTKESTRSATMQYDAQRAISQGKRYVPVLLEEGVALPAELTQLPVVRIENWNGSPDVLQAALSKLLQQAPAHPSPQAASPGASRARAPELKSAPPPAAPPPAASKRAQLIPMLLLFILSAAAGAFFLLMPQSPNAPLPGPDQPAPAEASISWPIVGGAIIGGSILLGLAFSLIRGGAKRKKAAAAPKPAARAEGSLSSLDKPLAREAEEAAAPAPATEAAPAALFISYAHADNAQVEPVVALVTASGRKIWIDKTGIQTGDGWAGEIVRAIKNAHGVVVMCSKHAFESDHVKREVYLADRYKKPMAPVFIEAAQPPEDFEYFFASVQWLELWKLPEADRPAAIGKALEAV